MSQIPEGICPIDGTINAHTPLLIRQSRRTAQKAINDVREIFGIIDRQLAAVSHVQFRQGPESSDSARGFPNHGGGNDRGLRKLISSRAFYGFPCEQILLKKIHIT